MTKLTKLTCFTFLTLKMLRINPEETILSFLEIGCQSNDKPLGLTSSKSKKVFEIAFG